MRVGLRVDTQGLDKCKAAFSGVGIGAGLEGLVEAGAQLIEGSAKGYAAVDTGFMRDSITHTTSSAENSATATVTSPASYSKYVEFGTRRMAAQPFMTPAFYENEDKVVEMLKQGVIDAIRAAIKG